MKKILTAVLLAVTSVILAAPVTLVSNGKANAVIVLDDKPTSSAQMAALEINHFLKKISGTELKVVKASDKVNSENKIIITSKLPRKVIGEYWKVAYDGKNITLSGQDSPVYTAVDYNKEKTFPKYEFTYNGTLFAAYQFLEDALGVRFLGIEEAENSYTPAKTVTADGVTKEYVPKLDAFRISTYYYNHISGKGSTKVRPFSNRDIALWQLRWRQCDFFGRTNHNQYSIYFKHWGVGKRKGFDTQFIKKRPELFAKGYTGKMAGVDPILRSNYPNDKDIPPQLCYSNPETVKYYADEVMTYFNGGNVKGGWLNFSTKYDEKETLLPRFEGKPFFYPVQGGDTGGYCKCADCMKRSGKGDVSNAKFKFIADVAAEVAKRNPAAGVSTLAYISTLGYPEKVTLPTNVSVQLCLTYYNWYHPIVKKLQHGAYKKWIEKEGKKRPLTVWLYTFGPSWDANHHFGKYKPFPGFYPHMAAAQMKEFAADGIRGVFSETELTHLKLEAYLLMRLAVDPTLDTQKLIDDYLKNYYGPAAKYMQEFYSEIEKAYMDSKNIPAEWTKNPNVVIGPKGQKHPYWGTGITSAEINWKKMGNPARMAKLKALMAKAEAAVKNHPQYAARLNIFKRNTWNLALEGEKEFRLLEIRMGNPPPAITPAKVETSDWNVISSKMERTANFTALNGKPVADAGRFGLAYDDKNLYLEYTDTLKPFPDRDPWRENIEIFLINGKTMYQMAVSLKGDLFGYKYTLAGKVIADSADHTFNIKPESKYTDKGWRVRMTIPWKELGANGRVPLGMNIFRSRLEGSSCWSPTFAGGYRDSFPHFGKVAFFPVKLNAANFTYHGKGAYKKADGANGTVGVMHTDSGWSLQCPMPDVVTPSKTYEVWVTIRGEFVDGSMNGKSYIGIYNQKARKVVGNVGVTATSINGKDYKRVFVGKYKLSPDMYFYIGGLTPKNADNKIYLKELEIIAK